jgi:hypothetical protein
MSKVLMTKMTKVEKMILELPKKEEKVLSRNNIKFIKMVKKSAKLMAPRDTGELANSISARKTLTKGKTQQYLLEVTAPHAVFQEEGFTPHFAYIRNSSKLAPGVYFVKKNTPFVKPSIERNIPRFFDRLNKGVRRAVQS